MNRRHSRQRVRDWDIMLARAQALGFEVRDEQCELVEVEREGRTSIIDLVAPVRLIASDARDIWMLKIALEDDTRWAACETYFLRKDNDEMVPVELRLRTTDNGGVFLDHQFPAECERQAITSSVQLSQLLFPLAVTNSIGYHRARHRIIQAYERLRPKSWTDLGVDDPVLVAEYEKHSLTPEFVEIAFSEGLTDPDAVIRAYGIPPSDGWVDTSRP
jgi:hypothetical protein